MSKKCPNCGYSEADDAKFCHICGQTLDKVSAESDSFEYDFGSRSEDKKSDDFEYDFGAGAQQSTSQSDEFDFGAKEGTLQSGPFAAASYTEERPYVGTTINNSKANKYKREAFSWAIFILFASVLGLILNLTDLSEVQEIQGILPFVYEEYYGMVSTAVNVYYAGIVLLVLLIVASIVLVVFGAKLNKFNFPVQNDDVFGWARKTFIVAIATTVLLGILCIVEIISFINGLRLQAVLEDSDYTFNVVFLVKDFIVFGGMIATTIYCNKLATCKQK